MKDESRMHRRVVGAWKPRCDKVRRMRNAEADDLKACRAKWKDLHESDISRYFMLDVDTNLNTELARQYSSDDVGTRR